MWHFVALQSGYHETTFCSSSPSHRVSLDGAALMLRHPGHAGILTTLSLHPVVCIIDLLLRHVTTLRNTARHAAVVGRKGGHIFGRLGDVARVDAVLVASWLGSIETCLSSTVSERGHRLCKRVYLNQVLAFWLGDERLQLRSREGVDEASLGNDEQKDLSTSKDRQLVGL
jgi:hypothetical protein